MKSKTKFKQTEIGKIPEDWEETRVGIVCKIKNGKTDTQDAVENGKYPLFDRSSQIKKSNKFLFDCEAIIIPGEGKDFIPRYFNGKFDLHQRAYAIWKNKGDVNIRFVYYWVLQNKIYLSNIAVGSTVKSLRLNHLENFPLGLPKEKEQKSIAKILSDLDAKIELNNKMNQILESIGQALFKKWFVDERKGEWKERKLGDYVFVERGLSYKGSGLSEDGIPLINLGNIAPNNHFRYEGLKFYSGDYKERNLVKPGDLIIANTDITQKREVLGSCLIVPSGLGSDKILFTHHIYAVRNKDKKIILPKHFLSYLLQTPQYRERATGFATGTTVLALPEDAILNFSFPIPDSGTLNKFESLMKSFFSIIEINTLQSQKLSKIRDLLLPKLMSGEIRVK